MSFVPSSNPTESLPLPAEFVDFTDTRRRWLMPAFIACMVAPILVAVLVAAILTKAIPPGPIWFVYFITLIIGFVWIQLLTGRRAARQIATKPHENFAEVLPVMFSSPWRIAALDLSKATKVLVAQGRRNVVAYVCRKASRPPIHPLTEIFEPVPVDESVPLFVALEREDKQCSLEEGLPASAMDRREATHRLKRSVTLVGGVGALFVFGTQIFVGIMQSLERKRIHPNLVMFSIFFILLILGLGGRGAWSWQQQWMLVPGGIVSRRSRMFRSATELHLFKRTESVLIAQAAQQKLWAVHVADAGASQMARMTAREAHLLLRAWLSPIPPPPIEQLSDLQ